MKKFKYILCLYPYKKELSSTGFMPPLGLESIATTVKDLCDEIKIVDMRFEKQNFDHYLSPEPDAVLISVNWYYEKNSVKKIIRSIPSHILTIVGGREATENAEKFLIDCPNIDFIVRGEGEKTVREILENNPASEIKGLSYCRDKKIIHNPLRGMDELIHFYKIDRSLRRYNYKFIINGLNLGYSVDGVFSSRGCPYNCKFCSFNYTPNGEKIKWRGKEPEDVVQEIKNIESKVIIFLDENFTHDVKRVGRICDLLIKEKIRKIFISNSRIEISKNPEVIAKMYKAGFRIFTLGIESSQDHVLKRLNKGFTRNQLEEGFKVINKFKIFSHGYFIIGNPDETKDEMLDIADFAHKVGLYSIGVSNLRCATTTPLYSEIINLKGYKIDKKERVYSEKYSIGDIKAIRKTIYGRFYNFSSIWKIFVFFIENRLITPKALLSIVASSGEAISQYLKKTKKKKEKKIRKAQASSY